MKSRMVGTYYIGHEQIEIFLRDDYGAEFYTCPEVGKVPKIVIGADSDIWNDIMTAFLHEVLEFCFSRLGCRYSNSPDFINKDHGGYTFIASHALFSEIVTRAAECTSAMPDLHKSWKDWKKDKRHK